MATKTTTTKKATAPKATVEVTTANFRGLVRSFTTVEGTNNRIVKFDTLSKKTNRPVQFYALLTDEEIYLAPYIKSKTVVEVTVKELPPVEGKRRFEIISLMSQLDKTNYDILLADAEAQKKAKA